MKITLQKKKEIAEIFTAADKETGVQFVVSKIGKEKTAHDPRLNLLSVVRIFKAKGWKTMFENRRPMTNKFYLLDGETLHFTVKHSDKMAGMISLSTSAKTNAQCAINAAIKGSICEHCFAIAQMNHYKGGEDGRGDMSKPFEKNGEILTRRELEEEELPIINALYFRLESFGDLQNATQFVNYYNIAKANPQTKFALWTKNPFIVAAGLARLGVHNGDGKRIKNLQIVLSSLFVNIEDGRAFWFVDKVFTVYESEEMAKECGVTINCGARNCFLCHRCYERKKGVEYINELLKK